MLKSIFIFVFSTLFTLPVYAGWTVWANLGGTNYSDPAACTAGNITVVFAVNSNRQISYRIRYLNTGYWSVWSKVPDLRFNNTTFSIYGSSPAVACTHTANSDTFELLVVGSNRRLWSITGRLSSSANTVFSSWYVYPGFNADLITRPVIAKWNGGQTHIFLRGGDYRIYEKVGTAPFQVLVSDTARQLNYTAVWRNKDRLDFFYRDSQNVLWQKNKIGNVWSSNSEIVDTKRSSPIVISRTSNSMDLFTNGWDGNFWHKHSENNVWGPWYSIDGPVFGSPGATVYANSTRMMVFSTFRDGSLRYKAWAP